MRSASVRQLNALLSRQRCCSLAGPAVPLRGACRSVGDGARSRCLQTIWQPPSARYLASCSTSAVSQSAACVHGVKMSAPARRSLRRASTSCVRASASDRPATAERQGQQSGGEPSWNIKMLYDGDCPLCMREVNMLKRRDADQGHIAFVDIAAPDYDPADNAGISFEQAMGEIHAIKADGTVVKNIDVFARLYEEVGLGWVYGFTKYEALRKAADAVYAVWARFRLPITGREDFDTILKKREEKTCR